MSIYIAEQHKYITFMEYLLSESINITPTKYGTNSINGKFQIEREPNPHVWTIFEVNDNYYLVTVILNTGEIILEHSKILSMNLSDYTMDRSKSDNVLQIFSKCIFVALLLIVYNKLDRFCFSSANIALSKIYKRLPKNPFFMEQLKRIGFDFKDEIHGYYVFEKITR